MKQNPKIIKQKRDLTYLRWSTIRSSSGTAGTFLKSGSSIGGQKIYYKLSNFDPVKGVIGHECINEIIVDRLLSILGVEHLSYQLINAEIDVDGQIYSTYLCASEDFKQPGESKIALDDFYRTNALPGESHYDFCARQGWGDYIDTMLAVDYIILNRDRHGANIEVLRNPKKKTLRIAPLFDHGLSLMYSCMDEDVMELFDINEDKPCQNFIGSHSCFENLQLIRSEHDVFKNSLTPADKELIFEGLEDILTPAFIDKAWDMIYSRYSTYANIRNI